jgi:hypothetical protein
MELPMDHRLGLTLLIAASAFLVGSATSCGGGSGSSPSRPDAGDAPDVADLPDGSLPSVAGHVTYHFEGRATRITDEEGTAPEDLSSELDRFAGIEPRAR